MRPCSTSRAPPATRRVGQASHVGQLERLFTERHITVKKCYVTILVLVLLSVFPALRIPVNCMARHRGTRLQRARVAMRRALLESVLPAQNCSLGPPGPTALW